MSIYVYMYMYVYVYVYMYVYVYEYENACAYMSIKQCDDYKDYLGLYELHV